jgi:hypothetical protein
MFRRNKPDEMEIEIRSKSIISAHYYTQFMLVVWLVLGIFKQKLEILPLFLFLVGLLIRGAASLIYRHDFGDERWKKGLIVLISSITVVSLMIMIFVGN